MIILTAVLMAVIFACVAFAVDVGYMYLVRAELQNVADSAALAAAAKLYPPNSSTEVYSFYDEPDVAGARAEAQRFAALNGAGDYRGGYTLDGRVFQLDENYGNFADGDIVIGRLDVPSNHALPLVPTTTAPNTVQVTARFVNGHANGSLSLFFARVLGITDSEIQATAAATVIHASLLPFATSTDKWLSLQVGGDGDSYTYLQGVTAGEGDGIPEITIFPDQNWDGVGLPPGNFGALSIGTETSGADDLRRQIDQGPTPAELAYHGALALGVEISGKTGMNSTVKTAFEGGWDTSDLRYYEGIIGHPRFLPVYSWVSGNGTNSQFTIVKFVGVRVMAVDMQGKHKSITLQPIEETKHLMSVRLTR